MAKVLSSISGNLISAASAGYAPTNSADVSAIASAYQVVSATATQLYAGTAFLTGVNGAPVSASRAGQAANASMATSAYYDGTGRLISALPDSAAVSSIASSYAESAASSKADSSSLSSYALSSDVSGVIDTVSVNSATWGAGATLPIIGSAGTDSATYGETSVEFNRYDTAGEPDIRTATLSPDALDITYTVDENNYYSVHINENGVEFSDPDGYYAVTPYDITNWNSAVDTVANNSAAWGQGGVDSATVSSIASSYAESAASGKLDTTAFNSGDFYTTANESGYVGSATVSAIASAYQVVSALGYEPYEDGEEYTAVTSINGNVIFADTARYANGARTARSAQKSDIAFMDFNGRDLSSLPGSAEASAIASSYAESAVSGKMDSSAMTSYVPYSSLEYNTASAISGINGSALAAGSTYSAGEGIDITDDVISVEAPVDIVAGPGIVIDNPDGNTLRVSTNENYETVLWEQSSYTYGLTSVTLSESYKNFETIKVYTNKGDVIMMHPDNSQLVNTCALTHFNASNIWSIPWSFTDNTHYEGAAGVMLYNDSGTMKAVTVDSSAPYGRWEQPEKIVGVHRIAGGN